MHREEPFEQLTHKEPSRLVDVDASVEGGVEAEPGGAQPVVAVLVELG
jgi:hypothetical protein